MELGKKFFSYFDKWQKKRIIFNFPPITHSNIFIVTTPRVVDIMKNQYLEHGAEI